MAKELQKPGATPGGERYQDGWRAGKPMEDPEKLKKWGFVSARPSEYLICIKDGRINPRRSGQGATLFKLPWESIAIVPTTLQRIEFEADQVTRERVGVRVTGIAVYRIAEPELAYRVLNFTYGERASEKLAATLREMFVGASRRLIANLSLEDCLTRRKEAIATYLMEEIAPVVRGEGAADDHTERGWGVVIDTIEIQNVHVLSTEVFERLQAPFRAQISAQAQTAELASQREVAECTAETERRIAEVELVSHREGRALKARTESEAAEIEAEQKLRAEHAQTRVATDELERKERLAQTRLAVEEGIALRQAESQATINKRKAELDQQERLELQRRQQSRELERLQLEQTQQLQKIALDRAHAEKTQEAEADRRRLEATTQLTGLQAELQLRETEARQATERLEAARAQQSYQLQTELDLLKARQSLELEMRERALKVAESELALERERMRLNAELAERTAPGQALLALATTGLPEVARALHGAIGPISLTHVGGPALSEAGPSLVGMLGQALTVARGIGLMPSAPAPARSDTASATSPPPGQSGGSAHPPLAGKTPGQG